MGPDVAHIQLRDGSTEVVTSDEGDEDSISLSSKCVIEYYPRLQGYLTTKDVDGRLCAYASGEGVLNPELLPNALEGTTDYSALELYERPKWLPDSDSMTLGYAVDYEPPIPTYWPPLTGDAQ